MFWGVFWGHSLGYGLGYGLGCGLDSGFLPRAGQRSSWPAAFCCASGPVEGFVFPAIFSKGGGLLFLVISKWGGRLGNINLAFF